MAASTDRLRPGDLRDQIIIQTPAYAPDGAGGRTLSDWSDIDTVWAEVLPISGGETFRLGVERASQFYRIRIRYREDVTTSCRIMLGTRPLNIRSCDDPNREREQVIIVAESGAADG